MSAKTARWRVIWLLRGSGWRRSHLRQCDRCYRHFQDDAPGAIDARLHSDDEAERCLDFRGYSSLTRCPACAAPLWQEAVHIAIYRERYR